MNLHSHAHTFTNRDYIKHINQYQWSNQESVPQRDDVIASITFPIMQVCLRHINIMRLHVDYLIVNIKLRLYILSHRCVIVCAPLSACAAPCAAVQL